VQRASAKPYYGFGEAARDLIQQKASNPVVLVSSADGRGEGMFISEMAMLDAHRPSFVVLRATKVLSSSDWNGQRYTLRYQTPKEVMDYLTSIPVRALAIDLRPGAAGVTFPHHSLLIQTIREHPDRWKLLGRYPEPSGVSSAKVEVYTLNGAENMSPGRIHIELPFTRPGQAIER
jgi:hypothetical protein